MRAIEAGDSLNLHGLGATYWDLYAELINKYLSKNGKAQPLLKWDDEIHPRLIRTGEYLRQDAVDRLEGLYKRERTKRV